MKYFLVQIKHTKNKDGAWTWEKGVVVKDTLTSARQSFHAYLGAYGYGNDTNTDYVAVYIVDINGSYLDVCVDNRMTEAKPVEV